jgi:CheY-like chemotaxis protein
MKYALQLANYFPEETVVEKPHNYRILVVDDNETLAKTIMWTLEILGHTAKIALDGQTALALATSFLPDVVLLDIGLPGMNGYEICQAMRKELVLRNTIIIAQTGWGEKEHRERSKKAGFDYHMVKPVNIEALKDILLVLDQK